MAVTKIWKVKDRLDNTIEYAVNGEKTEEKLYVSGINCMPDTALQEMRNTKKQFFKTSGIQCFYGVQSFVKGEVTPEQAHEIGMKLAEEIKHFNNIELKLKKIKRFKLHQKLENEKKEFEKEQAKKKKIRVR